MIPATALAMSYALSLAPALDVGWLEGRWCGVNGDRGEEIWTGAAHGTAVGLHKDLLANGKAAFEFMRIEVHGAGATFFGQPQGRVATEFRSVLHDGRSVVFENATHDFPKRVGYRRVDDETLEAWIDGGEGTEATRWSWRRCATNPVD